MVAEQEHVESARAVYDAAASRYAQFVGTEISPMTEAALDRSLLLAFIELIPGGSGARVADVGCGPGRIAAFLAHRGVQVVGVDVSEAMLAAARRAHPYIPFEEGDLNALPFETESLAGVVCWYSIIYTPPHRLKPAFVELARVLLPGGYVLLGFQAGNGEAVHRVDAHGTNLPLTNYLHNPREVVDVLEETDYSVHATVVRTPELEHETTSQGVVFGRRPTSDAWQDG
jgi:ubiquinone/menaquinone biosynthesis C-methylase UbiE